MTAYVMVVARGKRPEHEEETELLRGNNMSEVQELGDGEEKKCPLNLHEDSPLGNRTVDYKG